MDDQLSIHTTNYEFKTAKSRNKSRLQDTLKPTVSYLCPCVAVTVFDPQDQN